MKLGIHEIQWIRRWALIETFGAIAVLTGMIAGSSDLMATGAGILGTQIALLLARKRLAFIHGPVTGCLAMSSVFFGRPWYEGAAVALMVFSLLDLPHNLLVLISSMETLKQRLKR